MGLSGLCGDSTFWVADPALAWNSSWPQFSPCFQYTALVWVPCGWLWLALPWLFYGCHQRSTAQHRRPMSYLHLFKVIITVLLTVCALMHLIDASMNRSVPYRSAAILAPALQMATLILAIIYMRTEQQQGSVTSGVLFIFWLLLLLAAIVPFYTNIMEETLSTEWMTVSYIYVILVLVQFVLHCFADKTSTAKVGAKPPCPEAQSSFLSRLTYNWITRLIILGYKKPLSDSDMYDLRPQDKSQTVVPNFMTNLQAEINKHGRHKRKTKAMKYLLSMNQDAPDIMIKPFVNEEDTSDHQETTVENRNPESKPSLLRVLVKTFGPSILLAQLWMLIYDLLLFVNPVLLKILIRYTEDRTSQAYAWQGYVLAGAFFVVSLLATMFKNLLYMQSMVIGMRVRSAVIAAVYRKALTMNSQAKKISSTGEIVNLMAVDAENLDSTIHYIWSIWSGPFQIAFALYMLFGTVGMSMFAGFGVMCVLIPINAILMFIIGFYQEKQMEYKDERIKLISEVLNGIKILKLYSWEPSFHQKVTAVRSKELRCKQISLIIEAFITLTWTVAPYLIALATFTTYIYLDDQHYLSAEVAFVSLSLFNILRFAINLTPMMLMYTVQAYVSLKRLNKFLNHGDIDIDNVSCDPYEDASIVIEDGTFSWDPELAPCLTDINLTVETGSLIAVVGQVGMGKSSLISSILGETDKLEGRVCVKGSVAYVPQQAWIQNATIRDNVLFGKDMEVSEYEETVEACALNPDLEILPGKDLTEIGEKGINLSGGQKQRVSLARAVYNDADVYLMDDPLSAVDAHVGKHIFEKVIGRKGLLRNKTRILVTHGVQWLPLVDKIVVLSNGRISEMGGFDELMSHCGEFAVFLRTYLMKEGDEDEEDPEVKVLKSQLMQRLVSVESEHGMSDTEDFIRNRNKSVSSTKSDTSGREDDKQKSTKVIENIHSRHQLIEEETTEIGRVKWSVLMSYITALGKLACAICIGIYVLYELSNFASNFWLQIWTSDDSRIPNVTNGTSHVTKKSQFYIEIYGVFGIAQCVFILSTSLIMSVRLVRAASIIHSNMLTTILHAPMSFFDTTPIGRIINRFSHDIEAIDNELYNRISMWLDSVLFCIAMLVAVIYATPIMIAVFVPLMILYFLIQRFYIATSRQLERLESKARSPIYNHFSETVNGASVIRAYKLQNRFIKESENRVDANQVFMFSKIVTERWLSFRLELLGTFIVFFAALFAVIERGSINSSLVGLSITYTLELTEALAWVVHMTSDVETSTVSIERLMEYSELPTEPKWDNAHGHPPLSWPQEGNIEFKSYFTRYRKGLDPVLKGVSFRINHGEKIGIVGRTGAGKSSLTLSLFRLIEGIDGCIEIDGLNIKEMGLPELRKQLTILPQDPVLFSGTLRDNLDPFNQYSEDELWRVLEHAHLKTFIVSLTAGLNYECGEGGENLSMGQRQLMCLARALLRKTRILILDEATAAVDMETDELIQRTIRQEFSECTILSIAHRLNTVMESDRILVLDAGEVIEFDAPETLLQNTNGHFYQMARKAGLTRTATY